MFYLKTEFKITKNNGENFIDLVSFYPCLDYFTFAAKRKKDGNNYQNCFRISLPDSAST